MIQTIFSDPIMFFILMIVVYRNLHQEYFLPSLIGAVLGATLGVLVAINIGMFFWPNESQPIIFLILSCICMFAGGEKMTEIVVIEWAKFKIKINSQSTSKTQPVNNDFEESINNVDTSFYNSGGEFEFDTSRFNDKRTEDKYTKWKNTANDPHAPTRERARAIKNMREHGKKNIFPSQQG